MNSTMFRRRNLLIGGAIMLAIPLVAGILRKSFVQYPREVWFALVLLAACGFVFGAYVMTRKDQDR